MKKSTIKKKSMTKKSTMKKSITKKKSTMKNKSTTKKKSITKKSSIAYHCFLSVSKKSRKLIEANFYPLFKCTPLPERVYLQCSDERELEQIIESILLYLVMFHDNGQPSAGYYLGIDEGEEKQKSPYQENSN